MKSRELDDLLQTALRRKLTAPEEIQLMAYFAAHPEEQARWDEEISLTQVLKQLPDAPLASNFTAQVLRLVERQNAVRPAPAWMLGWSLWSAQRWIRTLTLSSVAILAGLVIHHQYRASVRGEVARSVATVFGAMNAIAPSLAMVPPQTPATAMRDSSVANVPSLEILEDFEAIKRLNQVPLEVDVELLAALQPSSR